MRRCESVDIDACPRQSWGHTAFGWKVVSGGYIPHEAQTMVKEEQIRLPSHSPLLLSRSPFRSTFPLDFPHDSSMLSVPPRPEPFGHANMTLSVNHVGDGRRTVAVMGHHEPIHSVQLVPLNPASSRESEITFHSASSSQTPSTLLRKTLIFWSAEHVATRNQLIVRSDSRTLLTPLSVEIVHHVYSIS